MSKKALIPIDLDPQIQEGILQIISYEKEAREKLGFLKKQANDKANDISESFKKKALAPWRMIEARLKELGKIPSKTQDPHLSFDPEANLIFEEDGEDSNENFHDVLLGIMKNLYKAE